MIPPAHARLLGLGVKLSRRGAVLARLGVVRAALAVLMAGGRRVPQWIAKVSSGHGESVITRLVGEVRKMPPETWPMVRAHWCLPKSFRGMADYLESLPASAEEAAALGEPETIPVTVLSASNATPAATGGARGVGAPLPARAARYRAEERALDSTRRTGACGFGDSRDDRAN